MALDPQHKAPEALSLRRLDMALAEAAAVGPIEYIGVSQQLFVRLLAATKANGPGFAGTAKALYYCGVLVKPTEGAGVVIYVMLPWKAVWIEAADATIVA